jgi:hypothetical protein
MKLNILPSLVHDANAEAPSAKISALMEKFDAIKASGTVGISGRGKQNPAHEHITRGLSRPPTRAIVSHLVPNQPPFPLAAHRCSPVVHLHRCRKRTRGRPRRGRREQPPAESDAPPSQASSLPNPWPRVFQLISARTAARYTILGAGGIVVATLCLAQTENAHHCRHRMAVSRKSNLRSKSGKPCLNTWRASANWSPSFTRLAAHWLAALRSGKNG